MFGQTVTSTADCDNVLISVDNLLLTAVAAVPSTRKETNNFQRSSLKAEDEEEMEGNEF